ncbi:MAG: hypothetical protein WCF99_11720 [Chloroflexales bacterium]
MSKWRTRRNHGALARLEPRAAGRPAQVRDPQQEDRALLQQGNTRLQAEIQKAIRC